MSEDDQHSDKIGHELKVQAHVAFVQWWRENKYDSNLLDKKQIKEAFLKGFMYGVIEACNLMETEWDEDESKSSEDGQS